MNTTLAPPSQVRGISYTLRMPSSDTSLSTLTTVFGGTGFLGRRVVRQLVEAGARVRIAARHPQLPGWATPEHSIELAEADVTDPPSLNPALRGADAAFNAVSLYVEQRGGPSFNDVHVEGAAALARAAQAEGVARLAHVSGLGVDPGSDSPYVRARWAGEQAVRAVFPAAVMLRPSVLFGPDDALVSTLKSVTRLPVVPLFGRGATRLQPVLVDDIAAAAARVLDPETAAEKVYELGGSETCSYRELVEQVLEVCKRRRLLLPVPFVVWRVLAALMKPLPGPPLTFDQVVLMERDNVVPGDHAGFTALGIQPRGVLEWLKAR